jgi:hypothetical protein
MDNTVFGAMCMLLDLKFHDGEGSDRGRLGCDPEDRGSKVIRNVGILPQHSLHGVTTQKISTYISLLSSNYLGSQDGRFPTKITHSFRVFYT